MVYNLSHRKRAAVCGIISLGIAAVLTYNYLEISKTIYLVFDVIAIGLSIFTLVPVVRNQVVTITDDGITVSWYGRKYNFTVDNFEMISKSKGGIISFRFLRGGCRHQITPFLYTNGEEMQREFSRILEDRIKEPRINIKPWLCKK